MDNVDEIKKRLDIVEFIGQYLQLKKVGINHSACCPFHSEKTPSFMVSPERQTFKCFGCSEGGDVITFFMKIENYTFPEALRILGERVGVQVDFRPKEQVVKEKNEKDKILQINLLAAKFFKQSLFQKECAPALNYLLQRGLSKNTIVKIKIGYAPHTDELKKYYFHHKFSDFDLSRAGHPERFQYRIMFPILDTLGQVIGFSGRILEDVLPKGLSPHPKYLNTPETAVFKKSRVLYGINLAKDAIREKKRVVVVEGQMDVAMSHEAGVFEVVATSGTALTQEHLKVLSRYSQNIIFSFDEDEAGQKAAKSAVSLALELGLDIKLTKIEKYKDVGELVKEDKSEWIKVIEKAQPPVEWLVQKFQKNSEPLTVQDKKELMRQALNFVSRMQDEIEKAHYISYLAKIVQVPEISVEKALSKVKVKSKPDLQKNEIKDDFESDFISFLIDFPNLVGGLTMDKNMDFENDKYKEIYNSILSCYNNKEEKGCLKKLKDKLPRDIRELLAVRSLMWDVKIQEDEKAAFRDFIATKSKLSAAKKETIKNDFAHLISEAESQGDIEKVKELMGELQKSLK
ncbi:MAG: DNA primase [Candidatus Berkelbacteria bacterium]|nr:DNA primase [Candidatus Berkelbacteria bacterium]